MSVVTEKRTLPSIYVLASTWIATPLIVVTFLLYLGEAIRQPIESFFPLGLSVFGITGALAGLCFSMKPGVRVAETGVVLLYAGEKFLHSAVLMIQVLILAFVKHSVPGIPWIQSLGPLPGLLGSIFEFLMILVAAAAGWSWYWAFEALNSELWRNWHKRIETINQEIDMRMSKEQTLEESDENGAQGKEAE